MWCMLQRTNIYLDSQLIQFYKQKASQLKTTMAEIIRTVLKKDMSNTYIQKQPSQAFSEIVQDARSSSNTPISIAENHDTYLYNPKNEE